MSTGTNTWAQRMSQSSRQQTRPTYSMAGRRAPAPMGRMNPRQGTRGPMKQSRPPPQQPQAPARPAWVPEQLLDQSQGEVFCKVRKVLSGDTLRLEYTDRDRKLATTEFELHLNYVRAPRVSRSPKDENEESFGFEAREFLRKRLIGAVVRCVWSFKPSQLQHEKKEKIATIEDRVRVYGSLQCLRNNPKQRYNEQVYRAENAWVSVAELLVANGYADMSKRRDDRDKPAWKALYPYWEQAFNAKIGKHRTPGSSIPKDIWIQQTTRDIDWEPEESTEVAKYKGKWVNGIIEDVRDGSMVRVEVIIETDNGSIQTVMLWLCLSGIQCLRMPKPDKTQRSEWEGQKRRGNISKDAPFVLQKPSKIAVDAKKFVERRLLHQDVTIKIEHYDGVNNKIFGQVQFEKHDISVYLLRQGLAKTQEWHMPQECTDKYLREEGLARQQKKGMWSDGKAPVSKPAKKTGDKWLVTQVSNADVLVLNSATSTKRVLLAHIRAPRLANQYNDTPTEDYAWEAKEFVRKRLITGKEVDVRVIYTRPGRVTKDKKPEPPLEFVTIKYESETGAKRDISEDLLREGLAELLPSNQMDKAPNYLRLVELQDEAKTQKKKGKYSAANYNPPHYTDYTLPPRLKQAQRETKIQTIQQKSTQFMRNELGLGQNIIRREKGIRQIEKKDKRKTSPYLPAVVEYVFGATRMKVRLEKEKKYIIFLLAGVQGIRGKNLSNVEQELANNATDMVKQMCQQRENVYVQIETLDKNSNFAGYLFLKTPSGRVNVGVELLKHGYAKCFGRSVERSVYEESMLEAESSARESSAGLWKYESAKEVNSKGDPTKNPDNAAAEMKPYKHKLEGETRKVEVIWAETSCEFFVTFCDESTLKQRSEVEAYMRTVNPRSNPPYQDWNPKMHDHVACLFQDGQFYRCKVVSVRKKGDQRYVVNFVDYGNREQVELSRLLPLKRFKKNGDVDPACLKVDPETGIRPLAKRCALAGLKPPPETNKSYFENATGFLGSITQSAGRMDVEILKVDERRRAEKYEVVLKQGSENINETMCAEGWARVDERNRRIWGGRDEDVQFPEMLAEMKKLQKQAQVQHRGMYKYGLVETDDEEY